MYLHQNIQKYYSKQMIMIECRKSSKFWEIHTNPDNVAQNNANSLLFNNKYSKSTLSASTDRFENIASEFIYR